MTIMIATRDYSSQSYKSHFIRIFFLLPSAKDQSYPRKNKSSLSVDRIMHCHINK